MENQKPSIGRIVHYMSRGSKDGVFQPMLRAAIITGLYYELPDSNGISDVSDEVDICVINPDGMFFNKNVKFGGELGQWSWPLKIWK